MGIKWNQDLIKKSIFCPFLISFAPIFLSKKRIKNLIKREKSPPKLSGKSIKKIAQKWSIKCKNKKKGHLYFHFALN